MPEKSQVARAPAERRVHPSISYEMNLLDRSVELAESAASAITTGEMPSKDCTILLGAGRMMQGASRLSLTHRLAANRLAMQEAKLIQESAES